MTQYHRANGKLSDVQLNKLKTVTKKNATDVT